MNENNSPIKIAKVSIASSVGAIIEWYDIFIAAFAASSVWPFIFYSKDTAPGVALALSIFTFFVTYLTRPLGAFIFGNYGDKIGRKPMLMWTLMLLGFGSLGIAVLPTYTVIGVIAPLSLIFLRAVQGIGIGGEFGGAITWVLETAEKSRFRAFWTSFVQSSAYFGLAAAAFAFVALSGLSHNDFLNYGWRIPFYIGVVMIAIGAVIRYKFFESSLFTKFKDSHPSDAYPSIHVIKEQWKKLLTSIPVVIVPTAFALVVVVPFSLGLLIGMKTNPTFVEFAIAIGSIVAGIVTILSSILGDRIGRKKVLLIGNITAALVIFPFFLLLQTGNNLLIILAYVMAMGLSSISYSVIGSFLGERFGIKQRYSGSGLTYHLMAFVVGLLSGILVPTIISISGGAVLAWPSVAIVIVVVSSISFVATLFVKDTKETKLEV